MFKFFRRKKFILIAIVIVIFFVGKYSLVDSKKTPSTFATVKADDIKEELTLSGKIEAQDHIILKFAVSGKVDWVGVKEGDLVKKGQIIATLEKETLEAALRQAWQTFTAAKAASDQYYDGRSGDSESYDEKVARTAIDATQNRAYDSIRIAQENLKSATLYSPIEGLVVAAEPTITGVNVTTLNSGYEIVNPSTIYLRVTADQTEVGGIKEGLAGKIIFDSYMDENIAGKVNEVSFAPTKDETGTVYNVKVGLSNIDNNDYKYRLGMTADIDFVIKEKNNILMIPATYINTDDKGKFVLVGEDKKKTYIKTGIESSQDVEIIEGLSEGEKVYD
ncbi:MAG: efflux RND transporter periplasmic adaptor subunit [Candidatus Levybacteria bacterium]|nr:efflux RND transporter periplasmic adaptor subunit [Candidatus Levybacteria bacterium]